MRVAIALALSLFGCADDAAGDLSLDDEDGDDYDGFAPKADNNAGLGGPLSFTNACAAGARITIGAVGDVLLHAPLQHQAIAQSTRFRSLWAPIEDLIAKPDQMYANFEGPSAHGANRSGRAVADPGFVFDDVVYSSYPQFNYHGHLPNDLKASGFDIVSTANNHSLDRHSLGADRTIDAMTTAAMPYTGTRRSDGIGAWHVAATANGIKLAWIACTFSTNGIPDRKNQVLGCWEDEREIHELIDRLETQVDAVIITPHWGEEYTANPSRAQRDLAHRFLDQGATLVLGAHPHVLQPWEKYKTRDGRETFAIYSLGNFVSGQTQLARRATILLHVGLTKTSSGVVVNGVSYVPLLMNTRAGVRAVEAIDRAGGSADARRLITTMFGTQNIQDPAKPLSTTPGC
jgi:poly-gamma-glutamate synthesis protein (capsule biosynthesis protein)